MNSTIPYDGSIATSNLVAFLSLSVIMNLMLFGMHSVLEYFKDRFPRFPCLQTADKPVYDAHLLKLTVALSLAGVTTLLGISVTGPSKMTLLNFIGSLLIYDTGVYFVHYMQHVVPSMAQVHKMHHQVKMFPGDTNRTDPVEFFEAGLPFIAGPLLFGYNSLEIGICVLFLQVMGGLSHCACDIPFLDCLDWFLVGPRFHAIHHVVHKCNYGVLFTFWDHLLGTAMPKEQAIRRVQRTKHL
ncbi:hypothetical protein EDD86DRAFT_48351 [Gorgonomyces haynaldii]|nr:hypothetical protein EDD86DRAFT_48351 [Gorgonomyces haynaldii]